ncbi:MAG: hypothetical protein MJ075_04045 [Oscillospiraceae bacterium]|nr:hypothetical protein [Oscillospiraceae bacterium]
MKRILKTTVSLALVLLLCLSLCSCAHLDHLRERRAELTENGDILFQNNRYVKLESAYQSVLSQNRSGDFGNTAMLVEPEVPDLLVEDFGISVNCNDTNTLIDFSGSYYVREDYRDTLIDKLRNPVSNMFCLYAYSSQKDAYTHQLADPKWQGLLNALSEWAESASYSGIEPSGEAIEYYWPEYIYHCDSDLLFLVRPFSILQAYSTSSWEFQGYYIYDDASMRAVPVPENYTEEVSLFMDAYHLK